MSASSNHFIMALLCHFQPNSPTFGCLGASRLATFADPGKFGEGELPKAEWDKRLAEMDREIRDVVRCDGIRISTPLVVVCGVWCVAYGKGREGISRCISPFAGV